MKIKGGLRTLIIVFLSIGVFINTLPNGFVWDDRRFINEWADIRSFQNIPRILAGAYAPKHEGKYRPVKGIILALNYSLWGENPAGYHMQAIMIHAAASVLVYLIIGKICRSQSIAFISGALFSLHPVHAEAIVFITSSTDIIGIVFMLAAFYTYIKKNDLSLKITGIILVMLFEALAFFTNEMALVFPLLILVYDFYFRADLINRRNFFRSYVPYVFVIAGYLLLRFVFIQVGAGSTAYTAGFVPVFLIMVKALAKYLYLLVWPVNLSVNQMLGKNIFAVKIDNPPIQLGQITDAGFFVSLFAVVGIIASAYWLKKRSPILSFSIIWFFVSLMPVLQFVPLPAYMAERYVYLPSFGFCLFLGFILAKLWQKQKTKFVAAAFFIVLAGFYFTRTYIRNIDWQNGLSLWTATLKNSPESMFAHNNLGNYYLENSDFEKAETEFLYAKSKNINHVAQVSLNLGKTYIKLGKLDLAGEELETAVSYDPRKPESYYFLGEVFSQKGGIGLAQEAYVKSISLNPNFYDSHIALGVIYTKEEKFNLAVDILYKAIQISPEKVHAYNNLAAVYVKTGDYGLALKNLETASAINPDNLQIKSNLELLKQYIEKNSK